MYRRLASLALAASLLALLAAAPAQAARPVAKARYAGVAKGNTAWAELGATSDRRRFRGKRSVVEIVDTDCGSGTKPKAFHLGARVGRGGRFHFTKRHGRFVFSASGRVKSRNTVSLVVRYRRRPARAGQPCDNAGRHKLTLRRVRRGHPAGCGERAQTRLWTRDARIFRKGPEFGHEAFGCLFSKGKAVRLDEDEDADNSLRLFHVAAPYVAYAIDACPNGCGWALAVADLRTGKKTAQIATGSEGLAGTGPVSDLEL